MAARQSNLGFRLMAAEFMVRDLLHPPRSMLEAAGVRPGMRVLDYGCGPGSYAVATAQIVGETGLVYALDRHPLAIASVRRICTRRGLANVHTVLSDCATGLPDGELDAVLLYDVLHDVHAPGPLLDELHRVLKPKGMLSVSDHHLRESEILSLLTRGGLFRLLSKGNRMYTLSCEGLRTPPPAVMDA